MTYVNRQYLNSNNHLYTLWTNYPEEFFCTYGAQPNDYVYLKKSAVVCNYLNSDNQRKPVIHFLSVPSDKEKNKIETNSLILVHEIAHIFGFDEIYEICTNHEIDSTLDCVMKQLDASFVKDRYNNICLDKQKPFCSYCDSLMKENTANIHIS